LDYEFTYYCDRRRVILGVNPVRVLLIAPSPAIVGGQSVQAARLLKELRCTPGLEIDFQPINPALVRPFNALQKPKYVRTVTTESAYVADLLRRSAHYDVLHFFCAGYWSFLLTWAPGISIAKAFGKPAILHYHDGRAQDHFQRFPRAAAWAKKATRIVTPSRYLVDVLQQFGLAAQPIANTIDAGQFRYRERAPLRPRFLHNRGLERHYNVPCSLRAFGIVQKTYPEATLTVAHDGPVRVELERMVAQMGLKQVTFTGSLSEQAMCGLYNEADLYLMSPDIDNMPLSVLECYASGVPIISTSVGGIPYLVENGRTGLLVPRNDHQAMAEAALRLLQDAGLAKKLSANGRQECIRYRGDIVAAEWAALYRELSSKKA
jgi:glycosyltransferase involved in cell wall biosynthesis